jgi:hypothetical protein
MRWVEPINPVNYTKPIGFSTEIETYIPNSLSWTMWGERSREIAVIGLDDPVLAADLVNEKGYWMDAETALRRFARMPFVDRKVPEDFRRATGTGPIWKLSSARRWTIPGKKKKRRSGGDAERLVPRHSPSFRAPASAGTRVRKCSPIFILPTQACRPAAWIRRCGSSWRTNSSKPALRQRR